MRDCGIVSRRCFLKAAAGTAALGLLGDARAADDDSPRVPTILEALRSEIEHASLSLKFTGQTRAECQAWQEEFGGTLRALLGPHRPPAEWKTTVAGTAEFDDHRREDLVLSADGHPSLPVSVLVPKPAPSARVPGVLALHGHGDHGNWPIVGRDDLPGVSKAIASANYDYGRQLVRRGYVVAAPCMTPFGPRLGKREAFGKQDPCGDTFLRMQILGKLLIAENLRDCLWSVELLARRPEVDAGKLACVGLSYGGRMTTLTAAVEPRIRVAVISGALNVMQERTSHPYSCGAQIIPGLLKYGDIPEIASLIAPRHCLWEVGSRDALISATHADEALRRMRQAWSAFDASDNLQVDRFEGGHSWNGALAYPLLERVLKA